MQQCAWHIQQGEKPGSQGQGEAKNKTEQIKGPGDVSRTQSNEIYQIEIIKFNLI